MNKLILSLILVVFTLIIPIFYLLKTIDVFEENAFKKINLNMYKLISIFIFIFGMISCQSDVSSTPYTQTETVPAYPIETSSEIGNSQKNDTIAIVSVNEEFKNKIPDDSLQMKKESILDTSYVNKVVQKGKGFAESIRAKNEEQEEVKISESIDSSQKLRNFKTVSQGQKVKDENIKKFGHRERRDCPCLDKYFIKKGDNLNKIIKMSNKKYQGMTVTWFKKINKPEIFDKKGNLLANKYACIQRANCVD